MFLSKHVLFCIKNKSYVYKEFKYKENLYEEGIIMYKYIEMQITRQKMYCSYFQRISYIFKAIDYHCYGIVVGAEII